MTPVRAILAVVLAVMPGAAPSAAQAPGSQPNTVQALPPAPRERAFLATVLATRKTQYPLGSRSTVVLTRGDERNEGREASHAALAELSSNSRHSIVAGPGHEIHPFQP